MSAKQWPDVTDPWLARHLVDRHMIAFYDRQPHSAVTALQQRLVGDLVRHAVAHSAWHRDRLQPFLSGGKQAFTSLPLMSRADYRGSLEAAAGPLPLPDGHGPATATATSGSSGTPVEFHVSRRASDLIGAQYGHERTRQGVDPRGVFARLMATIPEHAGRHIAQAEVALLAKAPEIQRRAQQFTMREHALWLAETRPKTLMCNPVTMSGLLEAFADGIDPPPIAAVITAGETVTSDLRREVRSAFGARVLDRYSCEEIGPLAFQCPTSDDHYHVAGTNALVEVLDEGGSPVRAGDVGRVHVTGLHTLASPAIRYELGDLSGWLPRCPCGHDGPVLTELLGRTRFLIRLPSGERKLVRVNAKGWLSVAPFRETRLVQVSELEMHAEFVLDHPITPEEHADLIAFFKREIAPDLTYVPVQKERIDWGPGYKRQDVVSLV